MEAFDWVEAGTDNGQLVCLRGTEGLAEQQWEVRG